MKSQQKLDTPRKGSWAEEMKTKPLGFRPSTNPTFEELDILRLTQIYYPVASFSPEHAARGYEIGKEQRKTLLTKV